MCSSVPAASLLVQQIIMTKFSSMFVLRVKEIIQHCAASSLAREEEHRSTDLAVWRRLRLKLQLEIY